MCSSDNKILYDASIRLISELFGLVKQTFPLMLKAPKFFLSMFIWVTHDVSEENTCKPTWQHI